MVFCCPEQFYQVHAAAIKMMFIMTPHTHAAASACTGAAATAAVLHVYPAEFALVPAHRERNILFYR